MLSEDIAKLMSMIPHEEVQAKTEGTDQIEGKAIYSEHHKIWGLLDVRASPQIIVVLD